jgi:PAS domain S-box-containing protein
MLRAAAGGEGMIFLKLLFTSGEFQPHGFCYQWNSGLVWLNVLSDVLIALAYFAIPIVLLRFIRKRKDLPFSWMFALFGVFIIACGTTHLMEVWNLWHAEYWLAGAIKAVTAAASICTAVLLVRIVPQALDVPSSQQWIQANAALQKEVYERRELELDLRLSEAKYRDTAELLDLTDEAIFVRNMKDEIVFWNRAAERLYGWRKEELRGRTSHDVLQTIFPKPVEEIETEILAKGHWEGELVHRNQDGESLVVFSRWALKTDTGGKPIAVLESNRDITEPRKTEEALRLSEEKLRLLLHGVKDYAILMLDPEGHITTWNDGAERIKGYRAEEIIGEHFSKFYPPEAVAEGKPAQELKIAAEKGRFEEEGWRVRKDGSRFWANVVVTALRDGTGQLRGFGKVTRDITSRKRADEKFKGLLESAPDAIVIVDGKGEIVLVNSQTERTFGYPREELIGQRIEILVPERHCGPHTQHRGGFFSQPRARTMGAGLELHGLRKDGTEFPVEISLSPLQTEEGLLVSSAIRDVTERKRTNEALKASEERLQMAVEAAQFGVWDLDIPKDEVIRSLRHDQIFGYDSLQPTWGVEIAERHIVPEDLPRFRASFVEAFKSNNFFMECRIRRLEDHSVRWICAQGRVYRDPAGKPIRMMGVVSDTTASKQAVEEAEQRRQELSQSNFELAAANKELEAFSYSVSHDLRAPLRTIDGFSLALLEDYADKLDAEGKKHLERVRAATQRMGTLIDDMLNLSRVTRASMRMEKTNISDVAAAVIEELKKSQPERHVEFRIEKGLEATVDSHLLRIILENLLGNAWKFTSKRAEAHIEFGRSSNNGSSAFFVRDDGAGFDPAYADRLFGAFQRLHAMSEFPGTGVGLATVQRIVHRHGGRIWAESSVGHGATFYFTLAKTSS